MYEPLLQESAGTCPHCGKPMVKTIHFLWLGDCKVVASTGEVYHSAEDRICMAQPGENLTVYQYRTRDNTITDLIQMEAY